MPPTVARLRPIPGVGARTAEAVTAFIEVESSDQLHVEIESGTQVAPRGPTGRSATPLV
jgi:hypothetical protein